MARFQVKIQKIHTQVIDVDAEDEDSARLAASKVLDSGFNQNESPLVDNTRYERTVDPDEWEVCEV